MSKLSDKNSKKFVKYSTKKYKQTEIRKNIIEFCIVELTQPGSISDAINLLAKA